MTQKEWDKMNEGLPANLQVSYPQKKLTLREAFKNWLIANKTVNIVAVIAYITARSNGQNKMKAINAAKVTIKQAQQLEELYEWFKNQI